MTKFFNKKYFISVLALVFLFCIFFNNIQNALAVDCPIQGSPGSTVICPTVSSGDFVRITISAYDKMGNVILNATYNWTNDLGITVIPDNSHSDRSIYILTTQNQATGIVTVTAGYGSDSVTQDFQINVSNSNGTTSTCADQDPKLVYGIAGITLHGATPTNYQYSTAEVLSTCYVEYKLYEGEGRK